MNSIHSESDGGSDDAQLFRRFLADDDDAFLELYRRHHARLHLYCVKMVGDRDEAEDLAQGMWERIIGLRTAKDPVEKPIGLFFRIARNLCIDHLRTRGRLVPMAEIGEDAVPMFSTPEPSELEELALASMELLSFEHREVLVLHLYCGYRYDEIAVMLGRTPDAIWARASRGRNQLRKLVARELDRREKSDGVGNRNRPNGGSLQSGENRR